MAANQNNANLLEHLDYDIAMDLQYREYMERPTSFYQCPREQAVEHDWSRNFICGGCHLILPDYWTFYDHNAMHHGSRPAPPTLSARSTPLVSSPSLLLPSSSTAVGADLFATEANTRTSRSGALVHTEAGPSGAGTRQQGPSPESQSLSSSFNNGSNGRILNASLFPTTPEDAEIPVFAGDFANHDDQFWYSGGYGLGGGSDADNQIDSGMDAEGQSRAGLITDDWYWCGMDVDKEERDRTLWQTTPVVREDARDGSETSGRPTATSAALSISPVSVSAPKKKLRAKKPKVDKPFKCTNEGCTNSYSQKSGLNYHLAQGFNRCEFAPNGGLAPSSPKRPPPRPRAQDSSKVRAKAKDSGEAKEKTKERLRDKGKGKAKAEDESPISSGSRPTFLRLQTRSYPNAVQYAAPTTDLSAHSAVRFSIPLNSGWNHGAAYLSSSSLSGALGDPPSAHAQGAQLKQEQDGPSQGSSSSYTADWSNPASLPQYGWTEPPLATNEELPPAATVPEHIHAPSAPSMSPSASVHQSVWPDHSILQDPYDVTQMYAPTAPPYREMSATSSPTLDPWGSQSWPQFQDQNASASSPMTPSSSAHSSPPTVSSSSASTYSISSLTSTPESYDHAPPSPSTQSQTTRDRRQAKTLEAQEMERALANAAALKRAAQRTTFLSTAMGATTQQQQPQPPPQVLRQSSQRVPVFSEQQVQEMVPYGMQELSADVVAFVASQISAMRAEAVAQSPSLLTTTTPPSPIRASQREGYLLPARGRPRRSARSDVSVSLPPAPTTAAVLSSNTSTSRLPSHPYLPAAEYRRHTANNSTTGVIESVLPPPPVPIQYSDGYRDLMAEVARVQEIAAVQERDRLGREKRERTEKRWGKKRAE